MVGVDVTASAAARYRAQVTSSMLWAGWADALGFISELTGESGLRHRTGGAPLTNTMSWTRRVGGKFGVTAQLPAGTYSDDTQLRLAVARSITSHGFDVETFARIELPVWPSYALGGGRASRAAAAGMAKANATWHTNFYDGWTNSGGNGAAMRIQPHVWAGGLNDSYVVPVLRDAIVTHGHPRALVGAVLHAVALTFALRQQHTPRVDEWPALLHATQGAVRFFFDDYELADIWVASWEQTERRSFRDAWADTVDECDELLTVGAAFVRDVAQGGNPGLSYREMTTRMGLSDKKTLGSGTATVAAALALAAAFGSRPADAALLAAHTLDTDTDTIATIAAAVIGAAMEDSMLPSPVQDEGYLRAEADRLADIALHRETTPFPYPDTLRWRPPQSQLEAVGLAEGRMALAGLGWLEVLGESFASNDAAWTWARIDNGPSFLVKHRHILRELPRGNWPAQHPPHTPTGLSEAAHVQVLSRPEATTLFDVIEESPVPPGAVALMDEVVAELQVEGFSDFAIGRALRTVATSGSVADWRALTNYLRTRLRR